MRNPFSTTLHQLRALPYALDLNIHPVSSPQISLTADDNQRNHSTRAASAHTIRTTEQEAVASQTPPIGSTVPEYDQYSFISPRTFEPSLRLLSVFHSSPGMSCSISPPRETLITNLPIRDHNSQLPCFQRRSLPTPEGPSQHMGQPQPHSPAPPGTRHAICTGGKHALPLIPSR